MQRKSTALIVLTVATALLVTGSLGLISTTLPLSTSGNVAVLEAYWDSACTNKTTSILWGLVAPGTTQTRDIWIKNLGSSTLNMTLVPYALNPVDYFKITWNREGTDITAGFVLQCTLTLTIYNNFTESGSGSFQAQLNFTGTA